VKRRKYSDGELHLIEKLKHENTKLKKTISSLRKQMARIDIDRFENIKELIERHDEQEDVDTLKQHEESLKKMWQCWQCNEGILQLIVISRRNGDFYFRKCSGCKHRTTTKPFTKDVKNGPEKV
jgi:hypothetical protein